MTAQRTAQTMAAAIEASVRIPGDWESPVALRDRLPDGYRLSADGLHLHDDTPIEVATLPPDSMFPDLFVQTCGIEPTKEELRRVRRYKVNFCLLAPAGDRQAVVRLMEGISAIIEAGGLGVFVDNSGTACGASMWKEFAHPKRRETGPAEAFCNIIRGERGYYSVGMHLFGSRDITIRSTENEGDDVSLLGRLIEILSNDPEALAASPSLDVAELRGLSVRVDPNQQMPPEEHPMYNPFGRWLVTCT